MAFDNKYAKQYLQKINEESGELMDEEIMLTLKQRSDLQEQKIQATFTHLTQNRLYDEAYLFIMEQTCTKDTVLDIKQRISWIIKGEGCLQKYLDSFMIKE